MTRWHEFNEKMQGQYQRILSAVGEDAFAAETLRRMPLVLDDQSVYAIATPLGFQMSWLHKGRSAKAKAVGPSADIAAVLSKAGPAPAAVAPPPLPAVVPPPVGVPAAGSLRPPAVPPVPVSKATPVPSPARAPLAKATPVVSPVVAPAPVGAPVVSPAVPGPVATPHLVPPNPGPVATPELPPAGGAVVAVVPWINYTNLYHFEMYIYMI